MLVNLVSFQRGFAQRCFGTDLVRPCERSAGIQGIDETRSAEDV